MQENVDFPMEIITNADLWEMENRINEGLELDLILGQLQRAVYRHRQRYSHAAVASRL